MSQVQDKIADQLSKLSPKVEDAVVEAVVDREVQKRSKALVQALDMLAQMEKDMKKLGFDHVLYDVDEKPAVEAYTKGRVDERKKTKDKINKLTNIISKALDKNDYNDLYQIIGGKQKDAKDDIPASTEE